MIDGPENAPLRDVKARLDALTHEAEALEGDVRAGVERLRAGLARVREEVDALGAHVLAGERAGRHASGADVDGARLTALDLVLRDTPRSQARSVIVAQFPGVDADLLLDEIAGTSSI